MAGLSESLGRPKNRRNKADESQFLTLRKQNGTFYFFPRLVNANILNSKNAFEIRMDRRMNRRIFFSAFSGLIAELPFVARFSRASLAKTQPWRSVSTIVDVPHEDGSCLIYIDNVIQWSRTSDLLIPLAS
jgi:hypothetical protein